MNESYNKTNHLVKTSIRQDLLNVGAIQNSRLEVFSKKTRDNPAQNVYRDTASKVIFIDDHYVGDMEYVDGGYRVENQLNSPDYEDIIDSERRVDSYQQLFIGKEICDFGCGKGSFLKKATSLTSTSCGVELQEDYAAKLNASGIPCYKSIVDIPKQLDVVTLFHCFEHLPRPVDCLKEIYLKLKPGGEGVILLEVPHARDFLIDDLFIKDFVDFTLWSQHLILHTRESLRLILAAAGFRDIRVEGVQRYGLSNHINWMLGKGPGGHKSLRSIFETSELKASYASALIKIDASDTLVAVART